MRTHRLYFLLGATMTLIGLAAVPALSGSTSSTRPDGGKTNTYTGRNGTVCDVFSPQGSLMCSRSFAIFNHKAGVAKCLKVKC